MEIAENTMKNVRSHRTRSRTQNSPNVHEIAMPECTYLWRRVRTGDGDMYTPCNTPVVAIETTSQRIVFREVESGDEAIAPSIEVKRTGEGDGR